MTLRELRNKLDRLRESYLDEEAVVEIKTDDQGTMEATVTDVLDDGSIIASEV